VVRHNFVVCFAGWLFGCSVAIIVFWGNATSSHKAVTAGIGQSASVALGIVFNRGEVDNSSFQHFARFVDEHGFNHYAIGAVVIFLQQVNAVVV
jgi:hypothetical protein